MGTWRRGVAVGRTATCSGRMKKVKKNNKQLHNYGKVMERKLRQLQRIIPGGGDAGGAVDMEALFQRIAVYIFQLESRVKVLKSVYTLFGPQD